MFVPSLPTARASAHQYSVFVPNSSWANLRKHYGSELLSMNKSYTDPADKLAREYILWVVISATLTGRITPFAQLYLKDSLS